MTEQEYRELVGQRAAAIKARDAMLARKWPRHTYEPLEELAAEIEATPGFQRTLKAERGGPCDHPFVEDYQWEHDNGYGRQSMVTGKRCKLCHATNNWGSSYWVKPDGSML